MLQKSLDRLFKNQTLKEFFLFSNPSNESAMKKIKVPIASLAGNSDNKRVIFITGGVHGDEYEGQVILNKLYDDMQQVKGHYNVIIMPYANLYASLVGGRVSPLDGGNLFSSFYGNVESNSMTGVIAKFIEQNILVKSNIWIDLHSGGKSLFYHPSAVVFYTQKNAYFNKCLDLAKKLNQPNILLKKVPESHTQIAPLCSMRNNVVYVAAELGGGGALNSSSISSTLLMLKHIINKKDIVSSFKSKIIEVESDSYIFSDHAGLFEPLVELNNFVSQGQHIANIWSNRDVSYAKKVYAGKSGVVVSMRSLTLTDFGDCLFEIGVIIEEDL